MNYLKSFFISVYVLFLVFASALALLRFVQNDESVYWLACFIACITPVIYFIYIFLRRPSSVKLALVIIFPLIGATFLITIGRFLFEGEETRFPMIAAGVSLVGWALYNFWYAKLPTTRILSISDLDVSTWSFSDHQGNKFTPSQVDSRFKMFLFHRGLWCPFCVAQIRDLMDEYQSIKDRGVQFNFISSSGKEEAAKIAKRMGLDANFLSDDSFEVAKKADLVHQSALPLGLQLLGFKTDQTRPVMILTDGDCKVLHIEVYNDYRERKSPGYLLRYVDKFDQ